MKVLLNFNNTVGKLEKDEFYIINVAVYPEYRGKGIGRRLMLESENYAVKRKIKRMVLDVEKDNVPAISLYKNLGTKWIKSLLLLLTRKYFLSTE